MTPNRDARGNDKSSMYNLEMGINWKRIWKADKVDEYISWFKWEKWQMLAVFCVLIVFGYLFNQNMREALIKANDWERKEQAKRTYNNLEKDYLRLLKVFPPNSGTWDLRGCGDLACPIKDNEGTSCFWGSDKPGFNYTCGGRKWFDLAPLPENPNTKSADQIKYKRLSQEEAVVEVCLERREDPEAVGLEKSKIGWTIEECPSGGILVWPDKYL